MQGVFFRGLCADEARRLGLTGFVRNCTPSSPAGYAGQVEQCVEVVAEGDEAGLKKLREWCKVGPPYARIENVEEKWEEVQEPECTEFKIVL